MAMGMKRLRLRAQDVARVDFGLMAALGVAPNETDDQAARRHLGTLFGAPSIPSMSLTAASASASPDLEHKLSAVEPLTQSKHVHFEQTHNNVPVYGGRVGVEMTPHQALIGIDAHVADVGFLDTVPTLSEDMARKRVEQLAPAAPGSIEATPALVIRYDEVRLHWALAYVFEEVTVGGTLKAGPQRLDGHAARRYRFFLDAHSGEEIVRVPLERHASVKATGTDKSGRNHSFHAKRVSEFEFVLQDEGRKISTTSIAFQGWDMLPSPLPGSVVKSNTTAFQHAGAIAAHAHAAQVFDFFSEVLKRNGINGNGGAIHSAVDCVPGNAVPGKIWRNAAWLRNPHPALPQEAHDGMMVYGQIRRADGELVSTAEGLDVVAHELTHGVTDYTAGLEYVTESGALNESYSDIFGTLIVNQGKPIDDWIWSFGGILNADGSAIRDLANPGAHGQPEKKSQMHRLKPGELPGEENDYGFVHGNSGVHNKAAFELIISGVFSADEVAKLYYLTLATPGRLGVTSGFEDSRDGLIASCETLFRDLPEAEIKKRTDAIVAAFEKVGF